MRRWGWVLIASTIWTFYVWGTRLVNIAGGSGSTPFKLVHYALAIISIAFGVAVGFVGVRLARSRA